MRHKFLAWVLIGLIAGWLSGKIMRGGGFGLVADLFVGLIGGVIGGWVFAQLGIRSYGFMGAWRPPRWARSSWSQLRDCWVAAPVSNPCSALVAH